MTNLFITDDKDFKKRYLNDVIIGNAREEAEVLFEELRGLNSFYKSNTVLGKLLTKFYEVKNEASATDFVVDFLYRKYKFEQQETNHIHIVFQYLFDLLGARAIGPDSTYQAVRDKIDHKRKKAEKSD